MENILECFPRGGKWEWQREVYLGQLTKKCTRERGTWQLGKVGRVGVCHEMLMCEPGVTNTKVGQDHLSVLGPLGGGTPAKKKTLT